MHQREHITVYVKKKEGSPVSRKPNCDIEGTFFTEDDAIKYFSVYLQET
mgnify:CR=1 FL=1